MRKKLGLILLCVLLLAGCGKEDGGAAVNSNTAENDGNNAAGNSGTTESDSAAGSSNAAGDSGEDVGTARDGGSLSLWINGTETIPFEEPEAGYQEGIFSFAALGNSVYLMRTEYPEDGGTARLCVQIYDSDTKETEKNVFTLENSDWESWNIISVDLTAKRELSLKLASPEGEDNFSLVKTDLQGTVLEAEETFPNADDYPWNQDILSLTRAFPLADGSVILCRWDDGNQTSVLTRVNEETGDKKPLGTLDGDSMNAVCCDGEGILYYYSASGSIVRWDVEKDVKEELMTQLYQDGITITDAAGLIWNEKGELLLCDLGREVSALYVLTRERPVSEDEIRLACVQEPIGNEYLQKMAAVFSREDGEIPVVMEGLNESDYNDYRNRIFADLVAGKGPEIMLVSYEDMVILQEKGLLCDLSDMISEDTLSQMIPGARELGVVNGQMAGITLEVAFSTILTADATWEADSWSISEFTELLKGREYWDWPVSFYSNRADYYTLFWMIFCKNLSDSPFLDLEQGKCCFDSEEFIDILNLCKKYGQPDSSQKDSEERVRMVKEGECLAAVNYLYIGFRDFSDMMNTYGSDCHIVGFPGEKGSDSYIANYSLGYLAVSANAVHKEEIKDFINYLLSYENQYEVMGTSVRMDVIRDSVVYYGDILGQRTSAESYSAFMEITKKPDGTSYLEEYLDFIENCKPEPKRLSQLSSIIGEELQSCFEGGRSAEAAAEAIQNRVQLYLDETTQ